MNHAPPLFAAVAYSLLLVSTMLRALVMPLRIRGRNRARWTLQLCVPKFRSSRPAPRRTQGTAPNDHTVDADLPTPQDSDVLACAETAALAAPRFRANSSIVPRRIGAGAGIGSVVNGRYRLDARLAVSGMASVFAATDLQAGRCVALKILSPDLADDLDARQRFTSEGAMARRVSHPAVVRMLDEGETEAGLPYLVMELLEGETLDAHWKRRGAPMRANEVVRILHGLLDVLSAVHAAGIVHGDVKPANVFLTTAGQIKLLDFGIARERGEARAAMPIGTPAFMPPEQVGCAGQIDIRSDLWSVAAMAFALITGRYVHHALTPMEVVALCTSAPAPSLSVAAPHLAPALARVLDRALRSDKAERWPDAATMAEALATASRDAFGRRISRRRWIEAGGAIRALRANARKTHLVALSGEGRR